MVCAAGGRAGATAVVKQVLLVGEKLITCWRTCYDSVEESVRLAEGLLHVQCLDGLGASTVKGPASDADVRDSHGTV